MLPLLLAEGPAGAPERPRDPFGRWQTGTLGMTILLASLGVLFAATLIGYEIIRHQPLRTGGPQGAVVAPPPAPELPPAVIYSTVFILISTITMQVALSAAKRGAQNVLRGGLVLTTVLALTFLVNQILVWMNITLPEVASAGANYSAYTVDPVARQRFFLVMFWVLTGLHAVHVIGGVIPMFVTTLRSFAGRYTRERHAGVGYLTMYWHFLTVVWIALFVALYVIE